MREPPRLPVPALRLVHEEPLAPVHPAAFEGLGVAEPVEVALQPPGRHAVEPAQERLQAGVQGVDHVDVTGGGVPRVDLGVPVAPGREAVGLVTVGDDGAARGDPRGELHGKLARARRPAPAYVTEAVAELVDAALDHHPLLRPPARRPPAVAPVAVAGPREPEDPRAAQVPLQAAHDQGAVDVEGPRPAVRGAQRHDLADPHAHEPRRVEGDSDAGRRLPQGERVGHALGEGHPRRRGQLRRREQAARARGERPGAAAAQPPLPAVAAPALAHEGGAAAPRAARRAGRAAGAGGELLGDGPLELGDELPLLLKG